MTAFKAQAMAQRLKQQLPQVVAGVTVVLSVDVNGFPTLACTVSAETVFVKITDQGNAGRVDGIGMPQRAYSPHKVQILRESVAGSVTPSQYPLREAVVGESVKLGSLVEIWEVEAPTSFDLTSATLIVSLPMDPINKLTNGQ